MILLGLKFAKIAGQAVQALVPELPVRLHPSRNVAQRLGIPRADAKNLIDGYFAQYPGIRHYMTETVEIARRVGSASAANVVLS